MGENGEIFCAQLLRDAFEQDAVLETAAGKRDGIEARAGLIGRGARVGASSRRWPWRGP